MLDNAIPDEQDILDRLTVPASLATGSIIIILAGLYINSLLVTTLGLIGFTITYPIVTVIGAAYALSKHLQKVKKKPEQKMGDVMEQAMGMFEDIELPETEEQEDEKEAENK